jgi:hypothetical protein
MTRVAIIACAVQVLAKKSMYTLLQQLKKKKSTSIIKSHSLEDYNKLQKVK